MKLTIYQDDDECKDLIEEYGIRKVKRAIENKIYDVIGRTKYEWDMDAYIKNAIKRDATKGGTNE